MNPFLILLIPVTLAAGLWALVNKKPLEEAPSVDPDTTKKVEEETTDKKDEEKPKVEKVEHILNIQVAGGAGDVQPSPNTGKSGKVTKVTTTEEV